MSNEKLQRKRELWIFLRKNLKIELWIADAHSLRPRRYEIRHDPFAGFYLFVYENDKCVRDHLQDTLEVAMECALEDYGVSKGLWRKIEK